jgi:hypothetical protein
MLSRFCWLAVRLVRVCFTCAGGSLGGGQESAYVAADRHTGAAAIGHPNAPGDSGAG